MMNLPKDVITIISSFVNTTLIFRVEPKQKCVIVRNILSPFTNEDTLLPSEHDAKTMYCILVNQYSKRSKYIKSVNEVIKRGISYIPFIEHVSSILSSNDNAFSYITLYAATQGNYEWYNYAKTKVLTDTNINYNKGKHGDFNYNNSMLPPFELSKVCLISLEDLRSKGLVHPLENVVNNIDEATDVYQVIQSEGLVFRVDLWMTKFILKCFPLKTKEEEIRFLISLCADFSYRNSIEDCKDFLNILPHIHNKYKLIWKYIVGINPSMDIDIRYHINAIYSAKNIFKINSYLQSIRKYINNICDDMDTTIHYHIDQRRDNIFLGDFGDIFHGKLTHDIVSCIRDVVVGIYYPLNYKINFILIELIEKLFEYEYDDDILEELFLVIILCEKQNPYKATNSLGEEFNVHYYREDRQGMSVVTHMYEAFIRYSTRLVGKIHNVDKIKKLIAKHIFC